MLNRRIMTVISLVLIAVLGLSACSMTSDNADGKFNVVATTTMLADAARVIGGNLVTVKGLMGPGIDPHLYKASAGDVTAMQDADLVVYSGLHLEGKMGEIIENLVSSGKEVVMIADGIDESRLITDEATGLPDPHIWFDVVLWKDALQNMATGLSKMDPANEAIYQKNYQDYTLKLDELDSYVKERIASLPEDARILVTAHDAFEYFGHAYDFEVLGLQGISTASEAGTADVKNLADFIVEKQIKAVFVESSVPRKNVEALQEAVKAQGFNVEIGGELFSDSLGTEGTESATYIGTVTANVDTIVDALK